MKRLVSFKLDLEHKKAIVHNEKATRVYTYGTPNWAQFERVMADKDIDKVCHDNLEDVMILNAMWGITLGGDFHDTVTRMTYIDEYADLSLKGCCKRFNIPFEDESMESVCKATYLLYKAQGTAITFPPAYAVDVKLVKLVARMNKLGVRIDLAAKEKLQADVEQSYYGVVEKLEEFGITPEIVNSPKQLGFALNTLGIHSPLKTATGAESWADDALMRLLQYPVICMIKEFKTYDVLLHRFLCGSLATGISADGRIHCTFTPNKREKSGAITGRFSSSNPNLQNIPARDKSFGIPYAQRMRELFLPEENHWFCALDYSQIEYLLLCHFATGSQAQWLVEQALAGVDFHNAAMQMTGITSRDAVKPFNYGAIYGMGWVTALNKNYRLFLQLAKESGVDVNDYAKKVFKTYHAKLPVIRDTMRAVQNEAVKNGYVLTLGGRKQHLPPAVYNPKTGKEERPLYKMLSKKIQGSAADVLKFAMCEAYEKGLFDVLPLHLTVHDELDFSVPKTKEGWEATMEVQQIMNKSFEDVLKVPMRACGTIGPSWGYWESDIWNDLCRGKGIC